MGLVERLERLAKLLDRERWERNSRGRYDYYNIEAVETSDLLTEAAKALRGQALLIEKGRHALARH